MNFCRQLFFVFLGISLNTFSVNEDSSFEKRMDQFLAIMVLIKTDVRSMQEECKQLKKELERHEIPKSNEQIEYGFDRLHTELGSFFLLTDKEYGKNVDKPV